MAKVNLSIGDDLLRQSKIAASHVDLSLSAVMRMLLEGFVKSVEVPADQEEALFLMMCRAGLPIPTLPSTELAKMAKNSGQVS